MNCFSVEEQELSISELAEKLCLPKSTISRLLGTLRHKNFIDQDIHTQRYRLGFRLYDLGNVYAAGMDLRKLAYPLMKELNRATSETVNLNIVDRGERVCIEKIESPHPVRNFVRVGERNSLCYGAAGKVLLAFLPNAEIGELVGRENLAVEAEAELLRELKKIRQDGYCITVGNRVEGWLAISAPIFDSAGLLIAGLSLSGPIERLITRTEGLTEQLLRTTEMISWRMGYSGRRT